mgnify:CR=1 FL=1
MFTEIAFVKARKWPLLHACQEILRCNVPHAIFDLNFFTIGIGNSFRDFFVIR